MNFYIGCLGTVSKVKYLKLTQFMTFCFKILDQKTKIGHIYWLFLTHPLIFSVRQLTLGLKKENEFRPDKIQSQEKGAK